VSKTRDDLIQYYKDLLIIQYRDKPRAQETIRLFISELLAYDLFVAIRDGFNLDTAIGAQLDILGKFVGVNRTITGTTFSRNYFGFVEYGATAPFDFFGYINYSGHVPDVQIRNYKESTQSLYAMTDEEMRVMIKLAIVRNMSNGSVKAFDEILDTLFGPDVLFNDRQNMTVVSYLVGENNARIFLMAKASGLLPNPAGVGSIVNVVPDITAIFGYSRYGGTKADYIVGYASYSELGLFEFDPYTPMLGSFYGICKDPAGNVWLTMSKPSVSDVGRIYVRYAGASEFIDTGADDLDYRHICSDPSGNIRIAVFGGSIRKAIAGSTTFADTGSGVGNWEGVAVDPFGRIWATLPGSDVYYSDDDITFSGAGAGPQPYRGIASDPDGNIFINIHESVVIRANHGSLTFSPLIMDVGFWSGITIDGAGIVWLTEDPGHVWRAALDDLVFSRVEQEDGYLPAEIRGVTVDDSGNVLITTSGSIGKAELIDDPVGCMARYTTI
jgi:hypothetical protein